MPRPRARHAGLSRLRWVSSKWAPMSGKADRVDPMLEFLREAPYFYDWR
jgi:hypothetical protein